MSTVSLLQSYRINFLSRHRRFPRVLLKLWHETYSSQIQKHLWVVLASACVRKIGLLQNNRHLSGKKPFPDSHYPLTQNLLATFNKQHTENLTNQHLAISNGLEPRQNLKIPSSMSRSLNWHINIACEQIICNSKKRQLVNTTSWKLCGN